MNPSPLGQRPSASIPCSPYMWLERQRDRTSPCMSGVGTTGPGIEPLLGPPPVGQHMCQNPLSTAILFTIGSHSLWPFTVASPFSLGTTASGSKPGSAPGLTQHNVSEFLIHSSIVQWDPSAYGCERDPVPDSEAPGHGTARDYSWAYALSSIRTQESMSKSPSPRYSTVTRIRMGKPDPPDLKLVWQ